MELRYTLKINMEYENRKYVILGASEVPNIDFSQVLETSADTLRYNTNKWFYQSSKTFVKFDGDTPSFLDGKTQYTYSEISTILSETEWNKDEDE